MFEDRDDQAVHTVGSVLLFFLTTGVILHLAFARGVDVAMSIAQFSSSDNEDDKRYLGSSSSAALSPKLTFPEEA